MKIYFYIYKNYGIVMGTALMLQVTSFSKIIQIHPFINRTGTVPLTVPLSQNPGSE